MNETCTKNTDKELAIKAITHAKRIMNDDPHLANYILRDLELVKDAELDKLSWAMHNDCPSKNDVEFLIKHLEKYIESH